MITRIEIDGFKSFHDFKADLRPFQVFIGPNGAGKSNLFDAIVLLSDLAGDVTIYDAFRESRGDVSELFTVGADGARAREMRFAVEMLIARSVADELGTSADVTSTRLRYELVIESRAENGFERLYVKRESLNAISEDEDQWAKQHIPSRVRKHWIVRARRAPYISTVMDTERNQRFIQRHQDKRAGAKQSTPIGRLERTILSLTNSAEYPTAYAARQEMINWRFLQLDPAALRTPSDIYSPTALLHDGSNLATVLYRMSREDEYALVDVARDMANLVSGVRDVSVRPIPEREEYVIEVTMTSGVRFSSRVLSDGTLRLLTLVTLKHDPHYRGLLCLEEPENGVHRFRLEQIVNVLRSLSTDFEDVEQRYPRQVLLNTHSVDLVAYVPLETVLYVEQRGRPPHTHIMPVVAGLVADPKEHAYSMHQISEFLNAAPLQEKAEELERAR
ncbi:MAG: AAA family ATPase [Anaerolineae bacterium]|nr:AAA family ATPase [Anaerolineae bacterium]